MLSPGHWPSNCADRHPGSLSLRSSDPPAPACTTLAPQGLKNSSSGPSLAPPVAEDNTEEDDEFEIVTQGRKPVSSSVLAFEAATSAALRQAAEEAEKEARPLLHPVGGPSLISAPSVPLLRVQAAGTAHSGSQAGPLTFAPACFRLLRAAGGPAERSGTDCTCTPGIAPRRRRRRRRGGATLPQGCCCCCGGGAPAKPATCFKPADSRL